MRSLTSFSLLAFFCMACGTTPDPGTEMLDCPGEKLTAIVHVDVIPMTGEPLLENQAVVVSDDVICALGPSESVTLPAGTTVVDGEGGTLIPGLSDMHVHLNYETDLALYLAYGVTTIRNMWGVDWTLELRDRIERGEVIGPRIFTTGPIMDGDPPIWPGSEVVTTPRGAADSVARQAGQGFDFIKVYEMLDPQTYQGIISAALDYGLPVVGHVPQAVGLEQVLRSGQSSIEHLTGYALEGSDGTLERLTAETGVWNCPTLVVYDKYARVDDLHDQDIPELRYLHPEMVNDWRYARSDTYDIREQLGAKLAELHQLGAPLMAGTDVSNPYVIAGISLHEELALLNQAGLSPLEALSLATVEAARYLGIEGSAGSIQPGRAADLVLLSASPLDDIQNTRKVQGVMSRGVWYPQNLLQTRLDTIAGEYQRRYDLEFDCRLPEGFLDPMAVDSLTFRLEGVLPDGQNEHGYLAQDFDLVLGGSSAPAGILTAYADFQSYNGVATLAVYAYGDYDDDYLYLEVPLDELNAQGSIDARGQFLYVAEVEHKMTEDGILYKECAVAVIDHAAEGSSLYLCRQNAATLGPGDSLQLAGNLRLTTEAHRIEQEFGAGDSCFCWNGDFEPLSCGEYEEAN